MTVAWEPLVSLLVPFLEAALVVALSVLPGWVFTKSLRRDPLARLLAAIVVSYTLLYLLEFGVYVVSGPGWLPLAIALVLAAVALVRIDESFDRRTVLGWCGLVAWLLGLQSLIYA